MKSWKSFKQELLKEKNVALEYEKLKPKYALISQLIEARAKKGITQKELAKKIGTKQSAIARLESGNTNPSLSFLEKIALALGYKLRIQFK
ncbi:MAG: helix-turn-helix transcriptional regulator [Patescibacteria group bacterium]|nr:helix-turn-helix transcriptional regulator [Patescibacteria group bacterium]